MIDFGDFSVHSDPYLTCSILTSTNMPSVSDSHLFCSVVSFQQAISTHTLKRTSKVKLLLSAKL